MNRDNIKRWTLLQVLSSLWQSFGCLRGAGIVAVFKTVGSVFLIKGIIGAVAAFFGGFSAATLLGIGLLVAGVVSFIHEEQLVRYQRRRDGCLGEVHSPIIDAS